MSLRDVFNEKSLEQVEYKGDSKKNKSEAKPGFSIKAYVHAKLLEQMDLVLIEKLSPSDLKIHLAAGVEQIVREDNLLINETDLARLVYEIQNEVIGLGPLEPLMADPTVSDILINNAKNVYVERRGRLEPSDVVFDSDAHLLKIIEKIVTRVGRRIDESSPMVDARLPDGSRVNAIIPPLALDGPSMSIRRFSEIPFGMADLIRNGALTEQMAIFLAAVVKAKTNLIISGGTGSGKTTLLNILSGYIPDNERIITIEDAAELRLQQPHVVRLETRPANIEGKGEVDQRTLVKNCLRMRPDRVVIGEIRGIEVLDMLQAMNTGHEGSLTTVHANTARDALIRLENMVGMAGIQVVQKSLRQQIASAISIVVQTSRLSDGKRKIMSITEVLGMEGDVITIQDIFTFKQTGIGVDGAVLGKSGPTGVRPRIADKLATHGATLPEKIFEG
ncbi:CpaF family protein [Polynucleobacter sp. UB-Tiil-W10]|uniref:CpaF family protein n=1 Tax=Polynucleobacter sp. UB-Tiil-W10 TaxID=1855648 RepID=UPI001C0D4702|nr:CpaF family protein [Polynucleobacter sp. UB-Tiil-W10]MBU3541634.1 CpaF family protein [Polynucleobacter sp. UB-Tiil-W10]